MAERVNGLRERTGELAASVRRRPRIGPAMEVTGDVVRATGTNRLTGLGAELAFWALLSLFPVLLVLAALLGSLEVVVGDDLADRAETAVVDALSEVLTDEGDGLIAAVEDLFSGPSPALLSFALLLALWTASRGFAALVNALDVVYDLDDLRGWLHSRALGLAIAAATLVAFAVLLAMVLLGPLFGTGQEMADRWGLGEGFVTAWMWLRWPFVAAVLVGWAATVYHVAPSHTEGRSSWRADLPGAVLATVAWVLATVGFRYYVAWTGGSSVAGAVGSVLLALLWLYALAVGLLVGGQLNVVLLDRARTRSR